MGRYFRYYFQGSTGKASSLDIWMHFYTTTAGKSAVIRVLPFLIGSKLASADSKIRLK